MVHLILPFLTSTQLFTQPNFLTRVETIRVRVQHSPTLLSSPGITWLPNFSGDDLVSIHSPSSPTSVHFPLCLYSAQWLQALRSIMMPLCSPCLAREGAVDLALLQGSCSTGPGAVAALVPVLVSGNLPSHLNLFTVWFSISSTILASKLHISWDPIGCSFCSSEDRQGVPSVHRGMWALLPPTSPPSSWNWLFILYSISSSFGIPMLQMLHFLLSQEDLKVCSLLSPFFFLLLWFFSTLSSKTPIWSCFL